MVKIECSVYEKYNFLEMIDYAKSKKIEECNNGKITIQLLNLELEKLNKLKDRVNGKAERDYGCSSIKYKRNHGTLIEKEKDDLPKAPFIRVN